MQNTEKIENKDKRVPKGPIKFNIQLSEEQKSAKSRILYSKVSVLSGKAGSSKTLLACQIALDLFFRREINRISFTRPTVSSEDIGLLPGSIEEKMQPWVLPLIDNMYKLTSKDKIDKMIDRGDIIFRPLQFIRGITFDDEMAILDEAQNATYAQTMMFLTRLGTNSKIILTGDPEQIDLRAKSHSGFQRLIDACPQVNQLTHVHLEANYRDPFVEEILKYYKA